MSTALEAHGLTKRYGATAALRDVDLRVEGGELVGLLGPNGAGKSTLVRLACGLARPDAGSVSVHGAPAGSADARRGLGYLAELFRFPGWLSADELLAYHQQLAGSQEGAAERVRLLELVELGAERRRRVGTMSKGMQQRLGIAQALVGRPGLILLDEPTSALDPLGRSRVRELLSQLREDGVAVLVNSHLLTEVERVCDRFVILDRGIVVREVGREELHTGGVGITTADGLRRYPEAAPDDVPALVRALVAAGEDVYEVTAAGTSIEDVYLDALSKDRRIAGSA